jgi:hypothetical protein
MVDRRKEMAMPIGQFRNCLLACFQWKRQMQCVYREEGQEEVNMTNHVQEEWDKVANVS